MGKIKTEVAASSPGDAEWLTRAEAAAYLGASERQMKRWTTQRRVTCVRDGQLVRYRRADLDAFVAANDGAWQIDTPKSTRSNRTVPILDDRLAADLAAYLSTHPRRSEPTAPLWPGRHPGTRRLDYSRPFNHRAFVRRTFAPACAATGVPAGTHWHSLRHTAASVWIAAGIPVFKVSRWLGYADVATTDKIYAHLLGEDYSAEAAAVSAYLARPAAAPAAVVPLREATP